MIEVICIDGKSTHPLVGDLPEGEIMLATQCDVYEHCYDIVSYEFGLDGSPCSHGKRRFIPTSNIDEVEEVEKLLQYLESEFYEKYSINP